jgi:hypothetical protein
MSGVSVVRLIPVCFVAAVILRFGTQGADQTFPSDPQTTYATTHVGNAR